jgi:hypothetical protein
MECYGALWSHLMPYETRWNPMVPFGPQRSHMERYGAVWSNLVPYGSLWNRMEPYVEPYGVIFGTTVPPAMFGPMVPPFCLVLWCTHTLTCLSFLVLFCVVLSCLVWCQVWCLVLSSVVLYCVVLSSVVLSCLVLFGLVLPVS